VKVPSFSFPLLPGFSPPFFFFFLPPFLSVMKERGINEEMAGSLLRFLFCFLSFLFTHPVEGAYEEVEREAVTGSVGLRPFFLSSCSFLLFPPPLLVKRRGEEKKK